MELKPNLDQSASVKLSLDQSELIWDDTMSYDRPNVRLIHCPQWLSVFIDKKLYTCTVQKCLLIGVRSHAPSIQSHRGTKVVWPDFQPMRVPEEPVCIDLFRQNPVFTSRIWNLPRRWTWTGDFKCREVKTGFYRNRSMQIGSSGTLIGWKSGQTTFVPLWDWMEGPWLRTQFMSTASDFFTGMVAWEGFLTNPTYSVFFNMQT